MKEYKTITTAELKSELGKENTWIIDTRDVNAYNGWPMKDELHGGHIKGARSFPFKWFTYMDWIETFRSKGIQPDDKLILYDYDPAVSEKAIEKFKKYGYHNFYIYGSFLSEWTRTESDLMERLPHYERLVPESWVKIFVNRHTPKNCEEKKTIIVHAHYRNRDAYLSGHIPGAIDMDTLALESPETWNRRSPKELKAQLEKHGITADTRVILYGKFMFPDNDDEFPGSAAGHLGAIRCNLIMMYAGVKDVRVLNGGYQSWVDAGYEISTEDVPKIPVKDFGEKIPTHPEYIVDMDEAKIMLRSKDAELVSVRSWREYIGEVSGYNYIKPKGRIPGAVFGNCGSDAYHMENYRNPDMTIREAQEVKKEWGKVGITPDKKLAFFCGTGWRGSEAFYNAWLMGWPKVAVYDGGWFEWSGDKNNPIETGVPA